MTPRTAMTMLRSTAMLLTLVMMSCNHRELCYDHTHWTDLRVKFDWSDAPDATPRTMVIKMFPRDGGEARSYEVAEVSGDGVNIRIPSGDYDAIAYNGDTETLLESGATYAGFEITTGEESLLSAFSRITANAPRPDGTEKQPVRATPETMWSATVEGISIVPLADRQTVTFKPAESTVKYDIVLKDAENANTGIEVCAVLSGVSGSYSPADARPSGETVTVPVSLAVTGENSMAGSVTIFGHCPSGIREKHILTVYTSNRYYYNYDVTKQVHDAPDPHKITIVIDGIKFPHPESSGISPDVDHWSDEINTDISMN